MPHPRPLHGVPERRASAPGRYRNNEVPPLRWVGVRALFLALTVLALAAVPTAAADAHHAADDVSFVFVDLRQAVVFSNITVEDGEGLRTLADLDDDGVVSREERQGLERQVATDADERDVDVPRMFIDGEPPRKVETVTLEIDGLEGPADAAGPLAVRSVANVWFAGNATGDVHGFRRTATAGDAGWDVRVYAPPRLMVTDHEGLDDAALIAGSHGIEGTLMNGTDLVVAFVPDDEAPTNTIPGPGVGLVGLALAAATRARRPVTRTA